MVCESNSITTETGLSRNLVKVGVKGGDGDSGALANLRKGSTISPSNCFDLT